MVFPFAPHLAPASELPAYVFGRRDAECVRANKCVACIALFSRDQLLDYLLATFYPDWSLARRGLGAGLICQSLSILDLDFKKEKICMVPWSVRIGSLS